MILFAIIGPIPEGVSGCACPHLLALSLWLGFGTIVTCVLLVIVSAALFRERRRWRGI